MYILRKRNFFTLTPSYLGNVSFETVTMAVNSQRHTLLCVITLCVCLSILYNQYVPFLDVVVLSAIFVVVPTRAFVWEGGWENLETDQGNQERAEASEK